MVLVLLWNNERAIEERKIICRFLHEILDDSLIFVDEFGISRHTSRGYAYSPINGKIFYKVRVDREKKVYLLVEISITSILCYEVSDDHLL